MEGFEPGTVTKFIELCDKSKSQPSHIEGVKIFKDKNGFQFQDSEHCKEIPLPLFNTESCKLKKMQPELLYLIHYNSGSIGFYIKNQNEDIVFLNYIVFGRLIKGYKEFIETNSVIINKLGMNN